MPILGYHASHEQLGPRELLDWARRAEQAGFTEAMCSDHFAPWSRRQGHSGFAWSWLGSALEATSAGWGVVNAPGQRYHPAIIAQAIATLAQMYPGRFWAALGSGEAMNEHITGDRWPPKRERNARLLESVQVIRGLLAGEEVSSDGLVRVDRARLWSLPASPPPLVAAAVTPATAAWAAAWADGLVTVNQPLEALRATVDAYREAGGRGPVSIQVHVSLAPSREEALAIAHDQWRSNVLSSRLSWDLDTPEQFDEATRFVRPEDLHDAVVITTDPRRLLQLVQEYAALGADRVYLHHVGQEQEYFLQEVGDHVLPQVGESA